MKSIIYSSFLFLFAISLNAQVGIGTTTPEAALDIRSSDQTAPTNQDGILIPKVDDFPTINPTASQDGMLVFVTGNGTPIKGFYYWDETAVAWLSFGGATGWLTTGNNDVNATSFLGTTTPFDVAFRRDNVAAGRLGTTSTSFGVGALNNGSGTNSTAIGNRALGVGTGSFNVAVGQDAMGSNASGAQWNVAIGNNALRANTTSSTQNNVAIGFDALSNQTGEVAQSVAIGSGAARGSSGNNNVAIGYWALAGNNGANTGIDNVAIGKLALQFDTSGQQNTALGSEALKFLTTGSFNTSVGHLSGAALDTGSNNTFLGLSSGNNVTSGSNNVIIGSQAQAPNPAGNNQIVIGGGAANGVPYLAFVNAPGWSYSSDRRLKSNIVDSQLGLDFIKTIRPVSYYRKQDVDKKTEFGFIAQELEIALNNAGETNTGILMKTADGMYAVRYNEFLPMTVKAVQEQQAQIETLQKQNKELLRTNAAILKRLEELEKKIN